MNIQNLTVRAEIGEVCESLDERIVVEALVGMVERSAHVAFQTAVQAVPENCKIIGHFSTENYRFSGAILHSLCICNRKFQKQLAFRLQFAVPERLTRLRLGAQDWPPDMGITLLQPHLNAGDPEESRGN